MRSSLSCGHSGKAPSGASSSTTKGRPARVESKPIVRIAGRAVRSRWLPSESRLPTRIAISSRSVSVASAVTAAIRKSGRSSCHSRFQRPRSSRAAATSISSAATAASGIAASSGALATASRSSSSAENTLAIGVRAPAS